jgi:hypothetical protein
MSISLLESYRDSHPLLQWVTTAEMHRRQRHRAAAAAAAEALAALAARDPLTNADKKRHATDFVDDQVPQLASKRSKNAPLVDSAAAGALAGVEARSNDGNTIFRQPCKPVIPTLCTAIAVQR